MKNTIMVIDLRPHKVAEKATGEIQDVYHALRRKTVNGELPKIVATAAGVAALSTLVNPSTAVAAYEPGTIMQKAQPIIQVLKDASEPLAYGMYIWAFIKYMQGQRGEAKELIKAVTFGFVAIQLLPWAFDIIKSIGDPTIPTSTPPKG